MTVLSLMAVLVLAQDGGVRTHPLDGVWQLDLEKSTDPMPALEKMGASVFLKMGARSVRPIHRIKVTDTTLVFDLDTPIAKRHHELALDGTTAHADEFFGSEFSYTTQLIDGAFISKGRMKDPTKKMAIELRRELMADGLMLYRITLLPDGEQPLVLNRVFRRVPQ